MSFKSLFSLFHLLFILSLSSEPCLLSSLPSLDFCRSIISTIVVAVVVNSLLRFVHLPLIVIGCSFCKSNVCFRPNPSHLLVIIWPKKGVSHQDPVILLENCTKSCRDTAVKESIVVVVCINDLIIAKYWLPGRLSGLDSEVTDSTLLLFSINEFCLPMSLVILVAWIILLVGHFHLHHTVSHGTQVTGNTLPIFNTF
jgi:hypothetical protein